MLKKILPIVFIFSLVFIFFFRLFYPQSSLFMIPDFGESDVLHLNLPFKSILSSSLKKGQWPLWTPLLGMGFPILAEGQMGTFYLPNLILFRFLPVITAYNLNFVIAYLLLSTGMYLFLRQQKFSKISSTFGSVVFTFSGFFSVHLNHFNLIQAASLLPFLFWSATYLFSKQSFKYIILFSLILSQQFFTGHYYIVFISVIGVVWWWSFLFFKEFKNKPVIRFFLIKIISSFLLTLLLTSIQLIPTLELWRMSSRESGLDFDTVTSYPYPLKHIFSFINPFAFGDPAKGTYPPFDENWGIFWENTGYLGVLPLIILFISLFLIRQKKTWMIWILLLLSLMLVLGKNSPLYFIFSIFPFNLFRVPSKYLLLSIFFMTYLTVFGFAYLEKRIRNILPSKQSKINNYIAPIIKITLVIILFGLQISDEFRFSYNYPPLSPADWWLSTPAITEFIKDNNYRLTSPGAVYSWNRIFLNKGWQDLLPYTFFRNNLYPNYNALFSIPQVDINTGGLVPRRLSLYTSLAKYLTFDEKHKTATLGAITHNALSLASVSYILTPFELKNVKYYLSGTMATENNKPLDYLNLYHNNDARPLEYLAFNTKKVATVEDIYQMLQKEDFLKENVALVEDDNLVINNNNIRSLGSVPKLTISDSEKLLKVDAPADSLLVVTDTYYPGWSASIDNQKVPIYTVNFIQKGIKMPKGNHLLRLKYQPQSFQYGKMITYSGWIIIVLVVFLYYGVFPHKCSDKKKI